MNRDWHEPVDPTLSQYDHAIAELRINGELRAHLACVVLTMWEGSPCPWFRVIWPDGRREPPDEDYGPCWWSVREWDAGKFTHWKRPGEEKRGLLGWKYYSHGPGQIEYEAAWLSREESDALWKQMGLQDSDFQ